MLKRKYLFSFALDFNLSICLHWLVVLDLLSFQYFTLLLLLCSSTFKEGRKTFQVGKSTQKKIFPHDWKRNSPKYVKKKKNIAERGFDPRTSGLWAQHASTAPLCCLLRNVACLAIQMLTARGYGCVIVTQNAGYALIGFAFFPLYCSLLFFLFWTDIQNIIRRLLLLYNRTFQLTVFTDILITLLQSIYCNLTIVL